MKAYSVCSVEDRERNRAMGIADDDTSGNGFGWWVNADSPEEAVEQTRDQYRPGTELVAVEMPPD